MVQRSPSMYGRVFAVGVFVVMSAACTAIGARRSTSTYTRTGALEVRTDGAVIDHVEVDGAIDVYASNVTIRDVRVRCGAYWCIRTYEGATHLTIEDADIGPLSVRPDADGLWVHSFVGRRLNIHDVSDGVKAWSDVRLEDSHIHELSRSPDDHSDGVQVQGGSRVALLRNRIEGGTNSAVFVSSDTAEVADVVLRANHLGGGAYTVGIRTGSYGPPSQVVMEQNIFTADANYGPITSDVAVRGSGNVDERTRQAIALPT